MGFSVSSMHWDVYRVQSQTCFCKVVPLTKACESQILNVLKFDPRHVASCVVDKIKVQTIRWLGNYEDITWPALYTDTIIKPDVVELQTLRLELIISMKTQRPILVRENWAHICSPGAINSTATNIISITDVRLFAKKNRQRCEIIFPRVMCICRQ